MEKRYDFLNTTLCYLEHDGKYLMLHRTKKKNDMNEGKWLGIGGKLACGESPFDCARREIREETGLDIKKLTYRGLVTFVSNGNYTEYMHLFTGAAEHEEVIDCDEGELAWVKKEEVTRLPIWEGDRIFLRLLTQSSQIFFLTLVYAGDTLIESRLEE